MKTASILFVMFLASCSARERTHQTTDAFLSGERLSELNNKNLREVSGIASSVNNPNHLWLHNDAGNEAEIYLVDQQLNVKLTCEIKGIENRDWEDIAVGPGPDPDKYYVYIGDIGDNDGQHQEKFVYRFEEPIFNNGEEEMVISEFDKITFRLDGGSKDTETLLLDPKTKNLYVVTKRENPVYLYELKYPYDEKINTAERTISLPMTRIVGGDFSPDGDELLVKNDDDVFYWKGFSSQPVTERLKSPPQRVEYQKEPQGEAITWARDGRGFFTLSEVTKGKSVYLYFYKRNEAP
jgi:WD40 repeat protein